ncbi:MAG: flagellar basal body P-ring protein FlgI [Planctomycetes bacterium]|nr:flagellar basal body P-ring protein FlgI [Planctomycetota bacterium]
MKTRSPLAALAALLAALLTATPALAVQVQDLVRIKGAETNKLVGMGLVVGLPGTGDGGKFLPAMRPLANAVSRLVDGSVIANDLRDAKNVALVAITCTLPATGVREGDHVDVYVSSIGPAKSLSGGRLFLVPLTGPLPNSPAYAFAEGAVVVESPTSPTTGVVRGGAQLTRDVMSQAIDPSGKLTLVLNDSVASWPMASNLAALINGVIAPDGPNIARAIDAKNVVIQVPDYERTDPAAFISNILIAYVDPSQIGDGAKVVINERTGTIIVSGDVQISPVIISHRGLTITTITPPVEPSINSPQLRTDNFVTVDPEKRGGAKLADLLQAFNQLKVDSADRISILKEIHRSGKLHAQLVLE